MSTTTLLELFGGFAAACLALWFVAAGMPSTRSAPLVRAHGGGSRGEVRVNCAAGMAVARRISAAMKDCSGNRPD